MTAIGSIGCIVAQACRKSRVAPFAAPLLAVLITTADVTEAVAIQVEHGSGVEISIEVNKGRLVRLDRPAQTVFIADPAIADIQVKSPRLVYLMGKLPGETTLFAVDDAEAVLANVAVRVTHNVSRLRETVQALYPEADIAITSIDASLVLDGTVVAASIAEDVRRVAERFAGSPEAVINRLRVDAPNQVNLRVRIAEVSKGIDKQLGFNWSILGAIGSFSLGLATANPFAAGVTQQTLSSAFGFGGFDFNTVVDALEEEGLIKILAEPNLTAVSGETASFLAGGEFPILVPDSDGRVTIEFKKFGVSLAFTPTVIGEAQISLHVRPEVSQLSNENAVSLNNFVIPSLITRRAETTVELGSGQTFAIAGLLQNNVTHDVSKVPGLGDIPVLGGLFRSDRFQRDESELVIIVTPYLVRPITAPTAAAPTAAAPTDGFAPPHDAERFAVGGTHRRNRDSGPPTTVERDGTRLIGPSGFALD